MEGDALVIFSMRADKIDPSNRPASKKTPERKNTQDDKSNTSTKLAPVPSILGQFWNLKWVNLSLAHGNPSY
jgi:hypothetical protein